MQCKWDVQKHVNWKNKGRKNDLHAFALKKKQTRSNTRSPPQKFDHIKHTFPHPKKEHSPKKKHHQNHKNPNQPTKNPNSLIHHPSTIQKLIIIIVREKKISQTSSATITSHKSIRKNGTFDYRRPTSFSEVTSPIIYCAYFGPSCTICAMCHKYRKKCAKNAFFPFAAYCFWKSVPRMCHNDLTFF